MNEPAPSEGGTFDAAPAVGTALSAVAMVGLLVPLRRGVEEPLVWVAAGFSALTVAVFLARRYGVLSRGVGGPVAAASSLLVLLLSGYAINQGLTASVAVPELPVSVSLLFTTFLAAGATVALGVADYHGVDAGGLLRRGHLTLVLALVGVTSLLAASIVMVLIELPATVALGELTTIQTTLFGQFGMAIGTAAIAAGYLTLRGDGLSYIDLEVPTQRDAAWTVGGIVALFAAVVVITTVMNVTGVESASHGTTEWAEENPEILLVLIPAAIFVIGPFEELLYRNVIQKSLYGTFSRSGAILVASVIFAAFHLSAYATAGPGAIIASLGVVFGLSIVLGVVYERTENLLVPALAHGVYDAILFTSLYLAYV